jgi:cytochrome c oxidase subunit III
MSRTTISEPVRRPPAPPQNGGFGGDGPGGWGASRRASFTGLLVLLAASVMLFAAFTSAYIVRRGLSNDWAAMPLPKILWLNTLILLGSSGLLEVARRHIKTGRRASFNRYWTAGTALGVLFLIGQAFAWRELRAAGIFLASNPSSSFFYLLTATHGIHLLGGIAALVWVDVRALRFELGPARRTGADITALFWHFLDGLWVYLLVLFSFWG